MYRKVIEMFVDKTCNTISQSVVISIISQDRNLVILQNLAFPYAQPSPLAIRHVENSYTQSFVNIFFLFFFNFFSSRPWARKESIGETPHSIGETPHFTMLVNYCMKGCRKLQDMEPEWRGLYNGHNLVPSSDRRQLD